MIAKHSAEESGDGEGVEVVANRPHEDPIHGKGRYTEKRMYGTRYAGRLEPTLTKINIIPNVRVSTSAGRQTVEISLTSVSQF
jgi:hypothetical protein